MPCKYIPNEKLMTIDALNINWNLLDADKSNSCCSGNDGRDRVVVYNTTWSAWQSVSRPEEVSRPREPTSLRNIVTESYTCLPERAVSWAQDLVTQKGQAGTGHQTTLQRQNVMRQEADTLDT